MTLAEIERAIRATRKEMRDKGIAPSGAVPPDFARIVKNSNNNVRESLMKLETELMLA